MGILDFSFYDVLAIGSWKVLNFLLSVLYYLASILANFFLILPDVSLPSGVLQAISVFNGYLAAADNYIPVSELLIVFYLVLITEGYLFSYRGYKWVRSLGRSA